MKRSNWAFGPGQEEVRHITFFSTCPSPVAQTVEDPRCNPRRGGRNRRLPGVFVPFSGAKGSAARKMTPSVIRPNNTSTHRSAISALSWRERSFFVKRRRASEEVESRRTHSFRRGKTIPVNTPSIQRRRGRRRRSDRASQNSSAWARARLHTAPAAASRGCEQSPLTDGGRMEGAKIADPRTHSTPYWSFAAAAAAAREAIDSRGGKNSADPTTTQPR